MNVVDIVQDVVLVLQLIAAALCIGVMRYWRLKLEAATAELTSISAIYHDHMDECRRG